MLTTRQWFLLIWLVILAVLTAALYYQLVVGYEPCVLCEIQRFIFIGLAIIMIAGVLHNPRRLGWWIYCFLSLVVAMLGAVFAGRQVWLQHLPASQAPACGPGLNFILNNMPPASAIRQIFYGTADCAQVHWRFLGLSFAGWSLVLFSLISLICLWQLIKPKLSR